MTKKTYPDHAEAEIICDGPWKGSITNYWPPRQPTSDKALDRMRRAEAILSELRRDLRAVVHGVAHEEIQVGQMVTMDLATGQVRLWRQEDGNG